MRSQEFSICFLTRDTPRVRVRVKVRCRARASGERIMSVLKWWRKSCSPMSYTKWQSWQFYYNSRPILYLWRLDGKHGKLHYFNFSCESFRKKKNITCRGLCSTFEKIKLILATSAICRTEWNSSSYSQVSKTVCRLYSYTKTTRARRQRICSASLNIERDSLWTHTN